MGMNFGKKIGDEEGMDMKQRYAGKGRRDNKGRKVNTRGYQAKFRRRVGVLLLAGVFAMSSQVRAQENVWARMGAVKERLSAWEGNGTKAELKLYHVHIGEEEEGTGCYTKDILHVHEGNPSEGGVCYDDPIYHEHTGDETEGGGCYGEKNYHVHEGNEADGGACYKEPVYHSHTGSEADGGGCYGTTVYHSHTGSAAAGGGCYGKEICHSHTGSAVSGGGCYDKPIYHSHTGSASSGGGCYTAPVYHSHVGDRVSGGICYAPVYHTHIDGCYVTAECTANYVEGFRVMDESEAYCSQHGYTKHVTFEGVFNHRNCNEGKVTELRTICWSCHNMDSVHEYPKNICGREGAIDEYVLFCHKNTDTDVDSWQLGCNHDEDSITGYEINCGKNETTVDSYQLNCGKNEESVEAYQQNCGKTEETVESYQRNCGKTEEEIDSYSRNCGKDGTYIDAYALSCQKTEETVDRHGLGCGREEGVPYAIFSLSNSSAGWSSEPVVLQAACEDKDGFLRLASIPFIWEDPYGDGTGEGDGNVGYASSHSVTENGVYRVRLMVENEDIDVREPILSIEVKNVDRTAPLIREIAYGTEGEVTENEIRIIAEDIQPDGSSGSGLAPEAYSFDGGKTWVAENVYVVKENGTVHIAVRDICGNISEVSVQINNISQGGGSGGGGNKDGDGDDGSGEDGDKDGDDSSGEGGDDGDGDDDSGEGGDKDGDGDDGSGNGGDKDGDDGFGDGGDKDSDDGSGDGGDEESGSGDGGDENGNGGDSTDGDGGRDKEGGSDGSPDDGSDGKEGKWDGDGNGEGSSDVENGNSEDSSDGNGDDGSGTEDEDGGDGSGVEDGNRESDSDDDSGEDADLGNSADSDKLMIGKLPEGKPAETHGMEEGGQSGMDRPAIWNMAEGIVGDREMETEPEIGKLQEKREEEAVKQQGINAEPISGLRPETVKKEAVIAPVVKAITFTVSGVAFAAVLLYLLYMMFRSIKVYHQDAEGSSHYAGSCLMKKTQDGFEVKLPDMIIEQSVTGQFILKPGSMFAANHKGEELIILAGDRKEAVWIEKEIPLKLLTFA